MKKVLQAKTPFDAYVAARTLVIVQPDPQTAAKAIAFAETALEAREQQQAWFVHAYGAALYRSGRLDEAIQQLNRSTAMGWGDHGHLQNDLVLAMAYWQRDQPGDRDRAKRLLQAVEAAMEKEDSSRKNGRIQMSLIDWMAIDMLYREAQQLLNSESTPEPDSIP